MSGRLPYHVNQVWCPSTLRGSCCTADRRGFVVLNQDNSATWGWTLPSIDIRMKTLPQKLQEAGYYTVQAGKVRFLGPQARFRSSPYALRL